MRIATTCGRRNVRRKPARMVVLGFVAAGWAALPARAQDSPAADTRIVLPDGFLAQVVADDLGNARHIAVRDNGDIYVALRQAREGKGVVCLRDTDGDGDADVTERFGNVAGTGIDIHEGYLYFGERTRVVRFKLRPGELVPHETLEVVVDGFPPQNAHAAKPITIDRWGHLYVNIGVPSNACQESVRAPGSPGRRPCPELAGRGIFRYDARKLDQKHPDDGLHYATGLRQTVALQWNHHVEHLYLVMHGRDQLDTLFPEHFSAEDNAELPAEEFHLVHYGLDAGWPYTYWDPRVGARMVAPEYGGDGTQRAEEARYAAPIQAFPAHWAPNDLLFYEKPQHLEKFTRAFPERYHHGAFVAFHGSWNRAPLPQAGYRVTFTPFDGARPAGAYETFADGFTGQDTLRSPGQAAHRPMGLAVGPDGALYIADSVRGTIWRVVYEGRG